ncbi:hypothetical protein AB6D11_00565 [Vibrio splendidus]
MTPSNLDALAQQLAELAIQPKDIELEVRSRVVTEFIGTLSANADHNEFQYVQSHADNEASRLIGMGEAIQIAFLASSLTYREFINSRAL